MIAFSDSTSYSNFYSMKLSVFMSSKMPFSIFSTGNSESWGYCLKCSLEWTCSRCSWKSLYRYKESSWLHESFGHLNISLRIRWLYRSSRSFSYPFWQKKHTISSASSIQIVHTIFLQLVHSFAGSYTIFLHILQTLFYTKNSSYSPAYGVKFSRYMLLFMNQTQ